ncbi:MAG TPA: hypothetical protein VI248_12140 [Kineosporiaceae bacterium]
MIEDEPRHTDDVEHLLDQLLRDRDARAQDVAQLVGRFLVGLAALAPVPEDAPFSRFDRDRTALGYRLVTLLGDQVPRPWHTPDEGGGADAPVPDAASGDSGSRLVEVPEATDAAEDTGGAAVPEDADDVMDDDCGDTEDVAGVANFPQDTGESATAAVQSLWSQDPEIRHYLARLPAPEAPGPSREWILGRWADLRWRVAPETAARLNQMINEHLGDDPGLLEASDAERGPGPAEREAWGAALDEDLTDMLTDTQQDALRRWMTRIRIGPGFGCALTALNRKSVEDLTGPTLGLYSEQLTAALQSVRRDNADKAWWHLDEVIRGLFPLPLPHPESRWMKLLKPFDDVLPASNINIPRLHGESGPPPPGPWIPRKDCWCPAPTGPAAVWALSFDHPGHPARFVHTYKG